MYSYEWKCCLFWEMIWGDNKCTHMSGYAFILNWGMIWGDNICTHMSGNAVYLGKCRVINLKIFWGEKTEFTHMSGNDFYLGTHMWREESLLI